MPRNRHPHYFVQKMVLLLAFFVTLNQELFAQKEAYNWYFGLNNAITFSTDPPTELTTSALRTAGSSASISDKDGNLLFYCDAHKIYDKNNQLMADGLSDLTTFVNIVVVPFVDSPYKYYVFIPGSSYNPPAFLVYCVVDMQENNGLGKVTIKNQLLANNIADRITATRHQNGNDYWLSAHLHNSDAFVSYLITKDGISAKPVITHLGRFYQGNSLGYGYSKFNLNGTKFCTTVDGYADLFDFDNSTGIFSNLISFDGISAGGIEFSADCSKLYIRGISDIFQVNLLADDIKKSLLSVYQSNWSYSKNAQLQIGPDKRIYTPVSDSTGNGLAVIQNPNARGKACLVQEKYVNFKVRGGGRGLPAFIEACAYEPYVIQCQEVFCQSETNHFELLKGKDIASVLWNFGDGETSTDLKPSHQYQKSGIFPLKVWVTDITGKKSICSKNISVNKALQLKPIKHD